MVGNTYNKLQRWTIGANRILEVRANIITTDKCSVPNTVFIEHAKHTSNPQITRRLDKPAQVAKQTTRVKRSKQKPAPTTHCKVDVTNKYVVYKIIRHIERRHHTKYVESWYVYEPHWRHPRPRGPGPTISYQPTLAKKYANIKNFILLRFYETANTNLKVP